MSLFERIRETQRRVRALDAGTEPAPVIEIGLTVIPDGDRPPYPATLRQPISQLLEPDAPISIRRQPR